MTVEHELCRLELTRDLLRGVAVVIQLGNILRHPLPTEHLMEDFGEPLERARHRDEKILPALRAFSAGDRQRVLAFGLGLAERNQDQAVCRCRVFCGRSGKIA